MIFPPDGTRLGKSTCMRWACARGGPGRGRAVCYDSALFPYARDSTVAHLRLVCGERLANHYNSDMTRLIEPGYNAFGY